MPDVSNLYQHMTAYNFLKYMAGVKGVKLSRQDISLLLNKVDLYSVEKQKIKTFSFGMKKKISIAQALIGYPKLLILDEPTSGLDPESSIKIQNLIRALNKENITIILTSHSLHEIEKISDRIAIIKNGKVGKLGTVTELKKQTSSYFNILIRVDPFLTNSVITKFNLDTNAHLTILDSTGRYLIIESNSEDIIPAFIEFLIKNKFKIFEVKVEEVSLEDIFLSY